MKTKVFLLVAMLFASVTYLFAQDATPVNDSSVLLDFGTFTGLAGIVSTIVTQLVKKIVGLQKPVVKILASVVVGIVVAFIGYFFSLSSFLLNAPIWQVVIYGVGAGLAGSGFYDIVKAILTALGLWKEDVITLNK